MDLYIYERTLLINECNKGTRIKISHSVLLLHHPYIHLYIAIYWRMATWAQTPFSGHTIRILILTWSIWQEGNFIMLLTLWGISSGIFGECLKWILSIYPRHVSFKQGQWNSSKIIDSCLSTKSLAIVIDVYKDLVCCWNS